MQVVMDVISYIVGLGSYIFVPMLMCLIGLLFGLSIPKAIKAGATVGIGLVGVSIVSTLTANSLGPVINEAVNVLHLNLTAIDVGGSPAAAVGFGGLVSATLIVFVIVVNVVMVALKLTNTINVDIYNFWYFGITAGFVDLITGNFWLGILAGVSHAILGLKVADIMAHRTQQIIGIEAIAIPHGFAAASAPFFMVLDKIYDRIPYFAHKPIEDDYVEDEGKGFTHIIGAIFGERIYLGLIMGMFFGIVAGYDFKGIADVTIKTAALMELFPMVVKMLVNGLIPISNQAKSFFVKHFPDRSLNIGLDSAVTIGHPVTISVGFLMIPFFMIFATIVHRANKRRTIMSSLIFLPIVLYISSWAAPLFTQLTKGAGMDLVAKGQFATTTALGNLFILIPTLLAEVPGVGFVLLIALDVVVIFGGKVLEKYYAKEDAKFEETIGIESM